VARVRELEWKIDGANNKILCVPERPRRAVSRICVLCSKRKAQQSKESPSTILTRHHSVCSVLKGKGRGRRLFTALKSRNNRATNTVRDRECRAPSINQPVYAPEKTTETPKPLIPIPQRSHQLKSLALSSVTSTLGTLLTGTTSYLRYSATSGGAFQVLERSKQQQRRSSFARERKKWVIGRWWVALEEGGRNCGYLYIISSWCSG
jgi:hypothetical protein